jgi:UPF0716 family protein affecting phage T7 exclusion
VPLVVAAFGLLTPGLATDLIGLSLFAAVYAANLLARRRPTT